ncbi:MAG: DNA repair exonuclease [Firmicutes bacterium]|jgi:DNA repair exonuclease SbcCD nuclease subunit|nr:DNA repair exonuclease [Bacillota bacterium]
MDKITLLHAADLHIDSPMHGLVAYEGSPAETVRTATRNAFESLVSTAIEEKVDLLLIAGDLYDGDWKDYNTGLFVIDRLSELNANNIRVVIIQGNHDAQSQLTKKLRFPPNTTLLGSKEPEVRIFDDLGVAVYGQSYPTRDTSDNIAANYPKGDLGLINIGMLHTCFDGTLGHDRYAPCGLDTLKSKGYDYWALGHVHKRKIIDTDPYIVFPGNLQGRHIRETGPKGASLVTFTDGEPSLDELVLANVRWEHCYVDISEAKSLEDCISTCYEQLESTCVDGSKTYAVRIEFTGNTNLTGMLQEKITHLTNEIRAMSLDFHKAPIWIEKVKVSSFYEKSLGTFANNELLGELKEIAQTIKTDLPSLLSDNNPLSVISSLKNKINTAEQYGLDDFLSTQHLANMTDEAVSMLAYLLKIQGVDNED